MTQLRILKNVFKNALLVWVLLVACAKTNAAQTDSQTNKQTKCTTLLKGTGKLPHGALDFSSEQKIYANLDAAFKKAHVKLQRMLKSPKRPSFKNIIEALEQIDSDLDYAYQAFVMVGLTKTKASSKYKELEKGIRQKLQSFNTAKRPLYARVKQVYETAQNLSPEQTELLETTYADFISLKHGLSDTKQARADKIVEDLKLLTNQFAKHVEEYIKQPHVHLSVKEVEGLSDKEIKEAKERAQELAPELSNQNRYSFDLKYYWYVLSQLKNPNARRKLWQANSLAIKNILSTQSDVIVSRD